MDITYTLVSTLRLTINILVWFIVIRCLLSWLPFRSNSITNMIYKVTDPILEPIKDFTNRSEYLANLPIDFSPVIAIVILDVICSFL